MPTEERDLDYGGALDGFRGILAAVPAAIVITAKDGVILFANQSAHLLFGYADNELDGAPLAWLVPPEARDQHRDLEVRFFDHPVGGAMGRVRDLYGVRKGGERIPIEIHLAPLALARVQLTVASISDLRDRRRLEAAVESASVQEQCRLGAELHDSLGQQLTTIGLLVSSLATKSRLLCPTITDELRRVLSLTREVNDSTRRLARDMTPLGPGGGDLEGALARLATQVQHGGLKGYFGAQGTSESRIPRNVAHQLFRIAQEATSNVIKHAAATAVEIELMVSASHIRLSVTDDGRGLQSLADGSGMGLNTMKHRAGLIGATLSIVRRASGGTQVSCVVPHSPWDHLKDSEE